MKKQVAILAFAISASGVFAQDLTSKKGEPILPETGDWALGIDATPFLEYAGNFFGKSSNNTAPSFSFLVAQNIVGKYFVDAKQAYRGGLRIGLGSESSRAMVDDRTDNGVVPTPSTNPYPNIPGQVENAWKHSTTNFGLTGGIEMRRGKTRLQGYYGGELGIGFSSSKDVFTYGNALNTSTANPVSVSNQDAFSSANNVGLIPGMPIGAVNGDGRVTERKNGAVFSFGLRGFIGVEYFLLPKISLGGEFGWGLGFASGGKTTTTWESIGNNDPLNPNVEDQVGSTTIEGSKDGSFILDTDNVNSLFGPSGTLRLNFHF
jgi:hypothetical protein